MVRARALYVEASVQVSAEGDLAQQDLTVHPGSREPSPAGEVALVWKGETMKAASRWVSMNK